jgi:hypothetical protein
MLNPIFIHHSSLLDFAQILAHKQRRRCTFAGGAGHLFGAAAAHVPCCEDAGDAGFQQARIAIRKALWPVAIVDKIMAGDNKALLVGANVAVGEEAGVGVEADEDERAVHGQFALFAAEAVEHLDLVEL